MLQPIHVHGEMNDQNWREKRGKTFEKLKRREEKRKKMKTNQKLSTRIKLKNIFKLKLERKKKNDEIERE